MFSDKEIKANQLNVCAIGTTSIGLVIILKYH